MESLGGLFTLFLTSPLVAIAHIAKRTTFSHDTWKHLQEALGEAESELGERIYEAVQGIENKQF